MSNKDLCIELDSEFIKNQEMFPIDCDCGCNEKIETYMYYESYGVCEYKVRCKQCNKLLGHWAYGHWQI